MTLPEEAEMAVMVITYLILAFMPVAAVEPLPDRIRVAPADRVVAAQGAGQSMVMVLPQPRRFRAAAVAGAEPLAMVGPQKPAKRGCLALLNLLMIFRN
jgi:hypothetical protein